MDGLRENDVFGVFAPFMDHRNWTGSSNLPPLSCTMDVLVKFKPEPSSLHEMCLEKAAEIVLNHLLKNQLYAQGNKGFKVTFKSIYSMKMCS